MTDLEPPRGTPVAGRRKDVVREEEPQPGAPSRDLRVRAAAGWERFMRRSGIEYLWETDQ